MNNQILKLALTTSITFSLLVALADHRSQPQTTAIRYEFPFQKEKTKAPSLTIWGYTYFATKGENSKNSGI
jgi:hypothetical protein